MDVALHRRMSTRRHMAICTDTPCIHLPLRSTCIRTHNHTVSNLQILSNPPQRAGLGIQIVDGHVEEALDLRGMQVHGDDVVAAGRL